MLIILTWHQILRARHCISPESFSNQLTFLKKNFSIIKKPSFREKDIQIILTFDDATVDFAYFVYPLLVEHQIPATLGVPTGWIAPSTLLSSTERLSLLNSKNPFSNPEAFCTTQELIQIKSSSLIEFAAHGHLHKNLKKELDFDELTLPKQFFQKNLQIGVDTFIFPYGAFHHAILKKAKEEYPFLFRLGTASNFFSNKQLFYRVNVDEKTDFTSLFTKKNLAKLLCKETFNRLRQC